MMVDDEERTEPMPDAVARARRDALLARLRSQPATDVGRWTRDELYDDEPPRGAPAHGG